LGHGVEWIDAVIELIFDRMTLSKSLWFYRVTQTMLSLLHYVGPQNVQIFKLKNTFVSGRVLEEFELLC